jgi:hypothetical protein
MTHFHANRRHNGGRPESLGSFPVREGAACAVLQGVGAVLQETGWQVEECDLPRVGLGSVRIGNLSTGHRWTWSVWGCSCTDGERDVRGLQ